MDECPETGKYPAAAGRPAAGERQASGECTEVVVEIGAATRPAKAGAPAATTAAGALQAQLRDQVFHYVAPGDMPAPEPGTRVLVPFGKKTVQGWVVGYSTPPPGVSLREILSVASPKPDFNQEQLRLAMWMADYYIHPLAGILKLMSPPEPPRRTPKAAAATVANDTGVSHAAGAGDDGAGYGSANKAGVNDGTGDARPHRARIQLNDQQLAAVREIEDSLKTGTGRQFLLHGIAGSGKTGVYLRASMTAIAQGRQVLYLVPEIALTPQAEAWFRTVLGGRVAVWHSRLAGGERYQIWEGVRQGWYNALIGPRSAVLAPFRSLGLVIVDEEQDASYKQQESPYYHARQVAVRRALDCGATLILGTATPSLESYTEARSGRYRLLNLTCRPQGRRLPRVTLVDLRREREASRYSLLSRYLREQIAARLQRREQVILFLNRRGFSPIVFCPSCGLVLKCERCSISLVYHRETADLRCHYCNYRRQLPRTCPRCGKTQSLRFLGTGIQRVELLLRGAYPGARIQRLDLDTTRRKGAIGRILDGFGRREIDILLGTQMVAKGHDFPGVTLVGVLNADLALGLPDYRSAERTYQLLAQVAGRAGRGRAPGEVVVQTYFPDHYSIRSACFASYPSFYREEIGYRAAAGYPPLGELIRIRVAGEKERLVESRIRNIAADLRTIFPDGRVALLGPAPAPVLLVKNQYRWQVMLKGDLGEAHRKIRDCIARHQKSSNVIINVEVDPYGF
jgi:primosomal protein N' (replication factor Y)